MSARRVIAVRAGLALLLAGPAWGSGRLPPMEIENRTLEGHAACRAVLEDLHRADLRKADPHPVPNGNGTNQTLIWTTGITAPDGRHAAYDVTETWQSRTPRPEARQIAAQNSYEERHWRCEDGHLTGVAERGYSLEAYEWMPGMGPSR